VGAKVTLIVQLPPFAATEAPQLFVATKSPLAAMLEINKGALPELVSVTGSAALVAPTEVLVKVRLVGETVTAGARPVRPTVCGLPGALSAMLTAASCVPVALGVNVTLMAQLAPSASEAGQVLETANSEAFTPVMVMLLARLAPPGPVSAADPVLVSTTAWAGVVTPADVPVKVKLLGDKLTIGATPTPVRFMVCVLPAEPPLLSVRVTTPLRVPLTVGVKVTAIVQLALGATGAEVEHVVVAAASAKSPLTLSPVMIRLPLPVLVSLTDSAALVASTC